METRIYPYNAPEFYFNWSEITRETPTRKYEVPRTRKILKMYIQKRHTNPNVMKNMRSMFIDDVKKKLQANVKPFFMSNNPRNHI